MFLFSLISKALYKLFNRFFKNKKSITLKSMTMKSMTMKSKKTLESMTSENSSESKRNVQS